MSGGCFGISIYGRCVSPQSPVSRICSDSRQPCLGFSRAINAKLRIPRRSPLAYFIHLVTAFTISAFFHILSLAALCPGWYPFRTLVSDMCIFFLMQPIGTMMELGVMSLFTRYAWKPALARQEEKTKIIAPESPGSESIAFLQHGIRVCLERNKEDLIHAACRLVGYVWVLAWFWATAWWFVKAYLGVGVQGWQFPFSFMAWLLIPGR